MDKGLNLSRQFYKFIFLTTKNLLRLEKEIKTAGYLKTTDIDGTIFDIEAMFLFPWSISLNHITSLGFWSMIDFIIELIAGFIYAWEVGALEWE